MVECAACCTHRLRLGQVRSFYTRRWSRKPPPHWPRSTRNEAGPVVVFDEAHLLDNAQLEAIRMLTNHDMDSGARVRALLIGQPTCGNDYDSASGRLDQRITVRYALTGMNPKKSGDYITHHVKIAGRTDTCSATTRHLIHNASRGYPARNNLA